MVQIINKTPHPIHILDKNDRVLKTFDKCPENQLVRLSTHTGNVGFLDDIPISKTTFGEVENLPEHKPDVYYIVSQMVKNAKPDRKDLLVPNQVIRDKEGQIVGCRSLGV